MARRRLQFVRAQIAWMMGILIGLSMTGLFSYEIFFVGSLIGLLILTEVTAPVTVTPQWRRRLTWIIFAGFVGFVLVVSRRFVEVIPSGVIPS